MKIRTVIRHIAVRVLPVLLLGAASAAAVLFAQGAYTFSFLKEDELLSVHTPSSPVGEVGEDDSGISPENGGAVGIPTPTVTRPQAARDESDILYLSARTPFTLTDVPVLQAAGFSRSTEPYTGESAVVANAGIFDFMPAVFSHYSDYRRELQYVRPTEMSEPVPVYTDVLDNVPAVQLYMGLILLDDGFFTRVYSADGVFLCEYFTGQYKCAYTRDRAGNPVFSRTVVNVQDDTSHTEYYTVEDGGMVKSDYDDALDGRGLYYDYPPAFGTPDNTLIRLAKRVVTVTDHPDGTQTEDELSSGVTVV